jgi:hypothetical protein
MSCLVMQATFMTRDMISLPSIPLHYEVEFGYMHRTHERRAVGERFERLIRAWRLYGSFVGHLLGLI